MANLIGMVKKESARGAAPGPIDRSIYRANLLKFRLAEGWKNPAQVARRAHIPDSTYKAYESGGRFPKSDNQKKIADVYGRPVDDFYKASPPPRPADPDDIAPLFPGPIIPPERRTSEELRRDAEQWAIDSNKRHEEWIRQQKKRRGKE